MDINALQRLHSIGREPVSVVGTSDGHLMVVCGTGQRQRVLKDKKLSNTRSFKDPDAVTRFLERQGVYHFVVELNNWRIEEIFDKHVRARELRNAAAQK